MSKDLKHKIEAKCRRFQKVDNVAFALIYLGVNDFDIDKFVSYHIAPIQLKNKWWRSNREYSEQIIEKNKLKLKELNKRDFNN